MKHAIHHIHFVGIGGSGMSGIAEVLFNQGYTVSGSDLADSPVLRRLQVMGIATHLGHAAAHVDGADAVVTSTAVRPDNPEVLAARAKNIPVVPRALMLAELMRMKQGIAIAGAHGKTTTTSLVASVLAEAGLDPTFVIGGRLNSAGANAKLGSGEYIVVEADESDASFLNLLPVMAVVTNIDADHMETYGHDFGRLQKAFLDFLHRMPFYGAAILCVDDPAVRDIVHQVSCPVTSYGFAEDAQVRAVNVRAEGAQMRFTVQRRNGVTLPDLDVRAEPRGRAQRAERTGSDRRGGGAEHPDDAAVLRALAEFPRAWAGASRAMANCLRQVAAVHRHRRLRPPPGGDGGHAGRRARRFCRRRLVLVFQPHRYTRTRDCFEDFVKVIGKADAVLLTEVYAAGEAPSWQQTLAL